MKHRSDSRPSARLWLPLLLLGAVALLWLVPAVVVALALPEGSVATAASEGAVATAAADPSRAARSASPGTGAADADADAPLPEEDAQPGDLAGAPTPALPSEAAEGGSEASNGTIDGRPKKRLGEVMAGDTVLRVGDVGLPVRFVQQRLNTAGIDVPESGDYDTATAEGVARLQEKFGLNRSSRVNRYTLSTLLQVTARGPALPAECMTGTVVCVDKSQRIVRLVIDGEVVQTLDARFGEFGRATDEGTFTVYDKIADDYSTEFGAPMRYSLYFSGGQAVHYSETFARDGYTGASKGCVNTRDLDATAALFEDVPVGASVHVYR